MIHRDILYCDHNNYHVKKKKPGDFPDKPGEHVLRGRLHDVSITMKANHS